MLQHRLGAALSEISKIQQFFLVGSANRQCRGVYNNSGLLDIDGCKEIAINDNVFHSFCCFMCS